LDDDEAVESHKEYLYDLCTLRGDGNNTWCRANNITLFPIFTGTSGDVLIGLMKVTQFTKKHIFLDILTLQDSFTLLENQFDSSGIKIHDDWKKKKENSNEYLLSPLDVILSEIGGIPGLIKQAFRVLQEILSKNIQNRQTSILEANKIIQQQLAHVISMDAPVLPVLTFLSLTGIAVRPDLKINGIPLSKSETHGLHLFRPTANLTACHIYIPPCRLLKMCENLDEHDHDLVKHYEEFLNLESIFKEQTNYSELFEKLNANRILLYLYTLQNISEATTCSIHQLFQTTKQNDIFSNREISINLKILNQIDNNFIIPLDEDEHMFKIDKHKKTISCLSQNHRTIENNKYGIYLLPKHHPRFDIFVKLPCDPNLKFDEVHVFVQVKTAQERFKESPSDIETKCDLFIDALDCHDTNYKKLTNRSILTCMVIIDSRIVRDDEFIKSLQTQNKYPCKIITCDELELLFPNFSHRFLIKNYKDAMKA